MFGQEINENVDVFVVPPQYNIGLTIFSQSGNFIVFGLDKTYYDTVFLAHEILHATYMQYPAPRLLKSMERERAQQIEYNIHSAIQYLADKELNYRLTGQSYLTEESHSFLIETMKKMYPYFLGYLYRNEEKAEEKVRTALLRDYRASQTETGKESELADVKFEQLSPKKIARFFKDKSNMSIKEFLEIDFENGEKEFGLDSWELPINFEPATVPVNNGDEQNRQQEQEQR